MVLAMAVALQCHQVHCQHQLRVAKHAGSSWPTRLCRLPSQRITSGRKLLGWEEVRLSAGAISGGGGLVGGNSGGSGGSGGGGKGGDGSGSGGSGMPEPVIGWKGWQDRVAVDPQFAYKMMIELLIGVTSMVAGDLLTRPNYGLDELDLVFATVIVGSIANFSAVYLLAPVAVSAGGAARQGLFQKLFGSYFLNRWGAPASHMFQPGFGLGQRATNFLYKGAVFSVIGMGAGVIGTALSNALLLLRKRMNPAFRPQSEPPSVMGNAAAWSLHMALSANSRYQLLNGLDMALQPLMPMSLFRLYTLAVRGANNVLGGITFVMLAKAVGAQKSAASAPHTPGAPAGRRVRKKK